VQELIEGQNLLKDIEQEPYGENQIRQLLADLLPVLEFIHEQGVVHRDIKPDNIIHRQSDGRLVLIDFGISKQLSSKTLSQLGTRAGTPGYAPAEQLQFGEAYPASDLYALGSTCIHLLTGVNPGELYNSLEDFWIWRERLPQSTVISSELEQIIDKLLQPLVKERYQSAAEVLQALNPELVITSNSIVGTWCGKFSNKITTLIITHQSDESFQGILMARDLRDGNSRIRISGDIELAAKAIDIREEEILSQPRWWYWSLGINKGNLSSHNNQMSGRGKDSRGDSYLWSLARIDYKTLTELLTAGKWKEADEETGALMLKIACRQEKGYLSSEAIRNFPCQELDQIDQLWLNYSNRHFGFSVQKSIWKNTLNWKNCGYSLGWYSHNSWKKYCDLNFTLNAPYGSLPTFWGGEGRKLIFGYWGCWEDFFDLLENCGL